MKNKTSAYFALLFAIAALVIAPTPAFGQASPATTVATLPQNTSVAQAFDRAHVLSKDPRLQALRSRTEVFWQTV